jgi:hypothetical protein
MLQSGDLAPTPAVDNEALQFQAARYKTSPLKN